MFVFGLARFLIYFIVSFFVLLIPIQNSTLFDVLKKHSKPARQAVIDRSSDMAKATLKTTKDFGRKLFTNSQPKEEKVISRKRDAVKSEQSAPERKNPSLSKIIKREELEHIGEDDMRRLDEFLRTE